MPPGAGTRSHMWPEPKGGHAEKRLRRKVATLKSGNTTNRSRPKGHHAFTLPEHPGDGVQVTGIPAGPAPGG